MFKQTTLVPNLGMLLKKTLLFLNAIVILSACASDAKVVLETPRSEPLQNPPGEVEFEFDDRIKRKRPQPPPANSLKPNSATEGDRLPFEPEEFDPMSDINDQPLDTSE